MEFVPLYPGMELDTAEANEHCPSFTPYLLEGEGPYPLIIVCPGGGYVMRAHHEGEPIAQWLNSIGVSALVLNYRVAPYRHPLPHQDAQRAIRLARHEAKAWHIDASRIGILGFSAGGHVASTAATLFDSGNPQAADPVERQSSRPDLAVLCYPVISLGEHAHEGSRNSLLGDNWTEEQAKALSNHLNVSADTPPAFLWHTVQDGAVPTDNSLLFAAALQRAQVPYALHIFEEGGHGRGLATELEEAKAWPSLCATWLKVRRFI